MSPSRIRHLPTNASVLCFAAAVLVASELAPAGTAPSSLKQLSRKWYVPVASLSSD